MENANQLRSDGILTFSPVVSSSELDRLTRSLHESPHDRVSDLFGMDPGFGKLLDHPELKALLAAIYPHGFHLATFSSNTLRQGIDKQCWHVDYPYHCIQKFGQEILGIQVNVAMDDFTVENGATHYLEKSHLLNRHPDQYEFWMKDHLKQMVCPKGTIVVYLGSTWHSQGVNHTPNPRSAILANFVPIEIPAKDQFENLTDPFQLFLGKVVYQ